MVRPVDRVLKVAHRIQRPGLQLLVPMVRPVDRVLKVQNTDTKKAWLSVFPWSDPWIGY